MHKVEKIVFLVFFKGNKKGEVKCLNVHYATTGLFPHLYDNIFVDLAVVFLR